LRPGQNPIKDFLHLLSGHGVILQRFPLKWDHSVIPFERETP